MRISLSTIRESIVALLLITATVCCRPMIYGNNYSPIALVIMFVLVLLYLIPKHFKFGIKGKRNGKTLLAIYLFCIYCLLQGVILGADQIAIGIGDLLYIIIVVTVFYMWLGNDSVRRKYTILLYILLIISAFSYAISLVMSFAVGWKSLYIKSIDYGYFFRSELYFPFTYTYGRFMFNGISVRRMLGIARECGISQVFYVWAYFMADKYFRHPLLFKIVMAFGVCACMSTAGFIAFGIALILSFEIKALFNWKTVVSAILIVAMVYVLFYSSGLSLSDKAQLSILDRVDYLFVGLRAWFQRPIFGHGYSDTLGYGSGSQVGINAISSLGQIGTVGFVIWLAVYITNIRYYKKKKRWIIANVAYLITALFSQPLMFAPITYWFFFTNYDEEPEYLLKKRRNLRKTAQGERSAI